MMFGVGDSVVVTTEFGGVYHGFIESINRDRREVVLWNANMAMDWGTEDGIDELALTGPTAKSEIAAMAGEAILLPGYTSVVKCAKKATLAWSVYKTDLPNDD